MSWSKAKPARDPANGHRIDVRDTTDGLSNPLPAGMVFNELEGQYGDGVLTQDLGLGSPERR